LTVIDWHTFFFLFAAASCCVFAVAVVLVNDVVRMAFCLIVSLGAVSALFFLAGADFLGALQLMIYVGGTLVLLVFGVMLTARSSMVRMKTDVGQRLLGGLVGLALLAVLLAAAFSVHAWKSRRSTHAAHVAGEAGMPKTSATLGLGLMGVRVDQLDDPLVDASGDPVAPQPGYLLAFEIVSVHLVVVLVGAAFLARARTRTGVRQAAADWQAGRRRPASDDAAAPLRRPLPSASNASPESPHP
jgi:NADH-quinone oxidoreductase subunit J